MRWLEAHGFTEQTGRASGHRKFTRPGAGSITVSGHGASDVTKKHIAMTVRALGRMGFDEKRTRQELETGRW